MTRRARFAKGGDNLQGTQMLAQWSYQLVREASLPPGQRHALLASVGLTLELLSRPDATISHDAACVLWERLTDGRPDDFGARFPEGVDVRSLGLLGYLAAASRTVGDMFTQVVRYHALVKRPATASLTHGKQQFSIVDVVPDGVRPWPRALAESVLSAWLIIGRRLSGVVFNAVAVRFQHAAPARPREVAKVFGCEEVTYRAAVNELVLPGGVWDLPLRTSDPTLLGYLETLAGSQTQRTDMERIRVHIARSLSSAGPPSLAATARALGLSARTLQRRLLDGHRITYKNLVDDVRRESAQRLMDDGGLNLEEISYLLGFNDPSALRKARRRWSTATGQKQPA